MINVVPSASARTISGPLLADPRLRKLSFTGSTEVGAALLKASADNILRTSMELGGNAPFLVFEDADIPAAVQGAVQAKMRNAGQTCVAANRFLVHASVAEEFTAGLTEAFDKLVVGHGADEGTTVGPLIESRPSTVSRRSWRRPSTRRTRAHRRRPAGPPGLLLRPTVLDRVSADLRVITEETFGPVAPVVTFGSEDEGVALANSTPFGLVAYAYTRDIARVMRLAESVETGMLGVNRGHRLRRQRAVRRREVVGARSRGRRVRHRGVSRQRVRRHLTWDAVSTVARVTQDAEGRAAVRQAVSVVAGDRPVRRLVRRARRRRGPSVPQAMALSLLMFSGGSQFAFIGVVGAGGLPAPPSRPPGCSACATGSTARRSLR